MAPKKEKKVKIKEKQVSDQLCVKKPRILGYISCPKNMPECTVIFSKDMAIAAVVFHEFAWTLRKDANTTTASLRLSVRPSVLPSF
jgi:hypothetical protein